VPGEGRGDRRSSLGYVMPEEEKRRREEGSSLGLVTSLRGEEEEGGAL